jgi:hypothetical protein
MKKLSLLLLSAAVSLLTIPTSYGGQEMPPSHPKIDLPTQSSTHQKSAALSGKVLQTLNSGGYSYINIQKKDGEKIWIAVKETKVTVGDQMSFLEGLVMKDFKSATLKRTFDRIIFSNGVIPQSRPEVAKTAPKDLSVPTIPKSDDFKKNQKVVLGSKPAVPSKSKISVSKAKGPNAYTVEEIYKKSDALDKKAVVVHGRVVKASTGIMKKTWLHIQDGTGSQSRGNHNLVCTTKGTANVGDIITVSGTLAKDRDFGYGYRYNVIIEDVVIIK